MLPKLALSITSFLPLYFLMIFMYFYAYFNKFVCSEDKIYIIIIITIIVITQLGSTIIVNAYIKNKESTKISENEIEFTNIREDKKAYVNYMMTYLLPLLGSELEKGQIFNILYSNFLIILFIIMNARAENFNFNIFLWVKGYSIYTGTNSNETEKILLIKKNKFSNLRENHTKYKFVSFGGSSDLYLCKKYPK